MLIGMSKILSLLILISARACILIVLDILVSIADFEVRQLSNGGTGAIIY